MGDKIFCNGKSLKYLRFEFVERLAKPVWKSGCWYDYIFRFILNNANRETSHLGEVIVDIATGSVFESKIPSGAGCRGYGHKVVLMHSFKPIFSSNFKIANKQNYLQYRMLKHAKSCQHYLFNFLF